MDIFEVDSRGYRGGIRLQQPGRPDAGSADQGKLRLKVRFVNGVIGRVLGVYDVVHPPTPMMEINLWGTKGTLMADYTNQKDGNVNVVYDDFEGQPVGTFKFGLRRLAHTVRAQRSFAT